MGLFREISRSQTRIEQTSQTKKLLILPPRIPVAYMKVALIIGIPG